MSETSGFLITLIVGVLFAFAIIIGIFWLLREVNCWYWKINKSIELMEENNRLLTIIAEATLKGKIVEPSPASDTISPNPSINTIPVNPVINNFSQEPPFDNTIPPVRSFVNGKIIFADGIQGEIMTDSNNQLFISIDGIKKYYYNSEENAINAIYILKTKGEISRKGLRL